MYTYLNKIINIKNCNSQVTHEHWQTVEGNLHNVHIIIISKDEYIGDPAYSLSIYLYTHTVVTKYVCRGQFGTAWVSIMRMKTNKFDNSHPLCLVWHHNRNNGSDTGWELMDCAVHATKLCYSNYVTATGRLIVVAAENALSFVNTSFANTTRVHNVVGPVTGPLNMIG